MSPDLVDEWSFGFLPCLRGPVAFDGGVIEDHPAKSNSIEIGRQLKHHDGWVYRSAFETKHFTVHPDGREEEVEAPRTAPPPRLWNMGLMQTHTLRWSLRDQGSRSRILPAICIQALAWAHGSRAQFTGWLLEGRIRGEPSGSFHAPGARTAELLDAVLEQARTGLRDHQVNLWAVLELNNRIPSLHWLWERFHWQYTVIDACWKLLVELKLVPQKRPPPQKGKPSHRERIEVMCRHLRIAMPTDPSVTKAIVGIRNNLAHEGLWGVRTGTRDPQVPSYGDPEEAWKHYLRLRKLTDRLLLHIIDFPCDLRHRTWDLHPSLLIESLDDR